MSETEEKALQELEACKAEVKKLVKEVVGGEPALEVLPIARRILLKRAPEVLREGQGVYDWSDDDKKRAGWEGQLLTVPGGLREIVANWFTGERLAKEDSVEVWRTAAGKMFDALEASEKRVMRMENVRVWYFAVDDQSYAAMTAEVVVGSKRYRKIILEKVVEGEKGAKTSEKKYRGPLVFQKGTGVELTPMAINLGRAVERVSVAKPYSGGTPGQGKRQ